MQNKVTGSGNSGSRICPAAQPPTESTKAYRDPLRIGIRSGCSWDPEDQLAQQDLRSLRRADNWQLCQRPHCLPSTTLGRDTMRPRVPTVCTAPTRNRGDSDQRTPGRTLRTRVLSGLQADTHHLLASEVSRTRHACLWEQLQGEKGTRNLSASAAENQKIPEESKMSGSSESPRDFWKPAHHSDSVDSCQTTPLIQFLWLWMTRGTCPWLNETAMSVSQLKLIWFGLGLGLILMVLFGFGGLNPGLLAAAILRQNFHQEDLAHQKTF